MNPAPEAIPSKDLQSGRKGAGIKWETGHDLKHVFPGHLNTNSPNPHSNMNTVAVWANHFRGGVSALLLMQRPPKNLFVEHKNSSFSSASF